MNEFILVASSEHPLLSWNGWISSSEDIIFLYLVIFGGTGPISSSSSWLLTAQKKMSHTPKNCLSYFHYTGHMSTLLSLLMYSSTEQHGATGQTGLTRVSNSSWTSILLI